MLNHQVIKPPGPFVAMRRIIKKTCVLLLATLYGPYALSAITPEQQAEIDYLLNAVEERRCRFVRNDISYSSSEFLGHLQSKLQLNEGLVNSSEEFIEKIGTRSAVSQIPYVALCDGQLKITQTWFLELLATYRSGR